MHPRRAYLSSLSSPPPSVGTWQPLVTPGQDTAAQQAEASQYATPLRQQAALAVRLEDLD